MSASQKLLLTISVMLASVMQALDTTIANVALPHIQGNISASSDEINWVLTSYITAAAVATSPISWLVSKFGSKKIFSISIAGFTFSSILCGISNSIEEIVLFRLMQGVFGAALVPLSQSTLLEINPPEKAGSAMALWGAGIMVGPILGPSLGGYLTDNYSWRWVFYINIPFGILSLVGITKFLVAKETIKKNFDKIGFILFSLFIISLQLILDRGNDKDWLDSIEINIYIIILFSVVWFLYFHLKLNNGSFISLALFKDRNFTIGLILMFLVGIILLSTMSIIPPMLQNLLNYPITKIGIIMVPRGLGTMVTMIFVGKLIGRDVDPRILMLLGLITIIFTLYQMSTLSLDMTSIMLVKNGFIQGIGFGLVFVPLTTISFSTLNPVYRIEATGLFTLIRNIGSSIGISIMSTLVIRNSQFNHEQIGSYITKYNINNISQSLGFSNEIKIFSNLINSNINIQSAFISYLNCFRLMMYVIILTIPLLLMFKYKKQSNKKDDIAILE